ncbi:hypothetical protein [Helicobacter trogontum]|uniref:Uncharacterized protein n=1 Tax=Helicobacter trogontum TaxID=50960 RepID=A0A4U8S2E0_9HELI|nr:hypothetical protein [Helicobacter trogontum]TLD79766.1 hypothetical protein LS81_010175 [Helicobacter trogontum]
MTELPFYCEIASKANDIMWIVVGVTFIFPIIPFLSLCLVVWNLNLLWELKQEFKKKDSTLKKQLQERKRNLIKRIAYASILPIMYLWFLSQDLIMGNLFGITYHKLTMTFTLFFLPIIFFAYNAILLLFSYTRVNFSLKYNFKSKRMGYIITIVALSCYLCCFVLGVVVYRGSPCRL